MTVLPPAGAAWSRPTAHVVEPPVIKLAGTHESEEALGLIGDTPTVVLVLPPRVAVRVTVCAVDTVPAITVNVAELVEPGTDTNGGTPSAAALLEASATELPPVGAG